MNGNHNHFHLMLVLLVKTQQVAVVPPSAGPLFHLYLYMWTGEWDPTRCHPWGLPRTAVSVFEIVLANQLKQCSNLARDCSRWRFLTQLNCFRYGMLISKSMPRLLFYAQNVGLLHILYHMYCVKPYIRLTTYLTNVMWTYLANRIPARLFWDRHL